MIGGSVTGTGGSILTNDSVGLHALSEGRCQPRARGCSPSATSARRTARPSPDRRGRREAPAKPRPLTLDQGDVAVESSSRWSGCRTSCSATPARSGPTGRLTVAAMLATSSAGARPPFARIPRQGRDGERRLGHRRDLHPVDRRHADRHLGDERHAGGDGLLRPAAAQPELLLRDRVRDLRHRFRQHRQLVDGRRHDQHRLHGHRCQHGPQSGHRRRRRDLGRLFRRQVVAAFGFGQSGRCRRRRRPLPPPAGDAADLVRGTGDRPGRVLRAGQPGDYDATAKMVAIRSTFTSPRCCSCRSPWWWPSPVPVPAFHHDLPRRDRRRRARRDRGAGARDQLCRRGWAALVARAAQGRLAGAGERLHLDHGIRADGHAGDPRRHGQHAQHDLAHRYRARVSAVWWKRPACWSG